MGFDRVISFFTGYVEVLVRGAYLEKLLNILTNSGLYLWDIRRLGNEALQAKIRVHGFLRIREYARKTDSTVKIHQKKGWPFLYRSLLRRKMLLFGAAVLVGLLIYGSSFIFFIKVEGFEGNEERQLIGRLAKLGLKPGVSRREVLAKKNLIEKEVMIGMPEAVWLSISIHGVVAEVTVVKRKTPPVPLGPCDLVAAKGGVISRLVVIRGQPVVKEGDTVAKGDLLISGSEWLNDPENGDLYQRQVAASGIVEARVWYNQEVLEPKIIWKADLKGPSLTEYKLRWGRKLWPLGSYGQQPEGNFSWTRWRRSIYLGRNPGDIVELIKDVRQTVYWRRVVRPRREMEKAALEELKRKYRYPVSSQPPAGRPLMTWSEEDNFLKLTVTYETVEDISRLSFYRKEHY